MKTTFIWFLLSTLMLSCNQNKTEIQEAPLEDDHSQKQAEAAQVEHDGEQISNDIWAPADTKSGSASSATLLYNPKITNLSGKVLEEHHLMKKYEYYLETDDGLLYALAIHSPPKEGINKTYNVTGVRLVPTAEKIRQLEREAENSLLPGQSIPKSPITDILYDVSFTLSVD